MASAAVAAGVAVFFGFVINKCCTHTGGNCPEWGNHRGSNGVRRVREAGRGRERERENGRAMSEQVAWSKR